jgi:hypothetical protein
MGRSNSATKLITQGTGQPKFDFQQKLDFSHSAGLGDLISWVKEPNNHSDISSPAKTKDFYLHANCVSLEYGP